MSDADITTLNRKRGNIKGQLKKLANALVDDEPKDISYLKAQLDSVIKLQEKFEDLKEDYYKIVSEEKFAETETTLAEVDDEIQKIEVSLKTSINKIKYDVTVSDISSKPQKIEQFKKTLIKLPEIPLPVFSGKFEEWNVFKNQFKTLIDENAELSDNEKLFYLRGSLKGDAKTVETSDDNYISLFNALEQRYENRRIIVDCHVKNILNLQPVKYESARDLRNLIDCIKKNLRSLKILEYERDKLSNVMLLNIILEKLDRETRKQYELTLRDNEVPEFDIFLEFLERRYQILNSINANISHKSHSERSKSLFIKSNKNTSKLCVACKTETHALFHCNKFKEMKLSERLELVKKHRLCFNCLSDIHLLAQCNSKSSCFVCKKKLDHHTLLHTFVMSRNPVAAERGTSQPINNSESTNSQMVENSQVTFFTNNKSKSILINTAIIYVKDSRGIRRPLRCILDSASESNFVCSRTADALGLQKEKINIPIIGLNDSSINIKRKVSAQISNANNDARWEIDLLLVPKISNFSPAKKINVDLLNIPSNINLADPSFSIPQRVDMLLGAELFFALLEKDKIKIGNNLFLQSSCFGYLVSGDISDYNLETSTKQCFLAKNLDDLNKTLTNFWEIEDVESQKACNSEELNYCNEHFAKTHFRKADGRYVVSMPLRPELPETRLGNSKMIASKRLDQLWTRLERDPTMKALYTDFLREYESLQHMKEVKENSNFEAGYYLPHHGILRPENKTTKLRVVFNASAKTTSGYSLNDLLFKGGVLQDDLFSILIRFRKHIYAFTADIKQMFRMIELNESQTKLQKILWKNSKSSPTKVYELRTVTYGTASAPYLATKVLQQLALDEEENFPMASKVLLRDLYMDDCLSGSSELTEFETLQLELKQLLQRGGMTLHKWCTNLSPTTRHEEFPLDRNSEEIQVKTLGMIWNSTSDTFTYKTNVSIQRSYTKRDVLSQIARIYDPLGLLGPIISKAKIFMQQLWLLKLDWYEILPPDISQQWENFVKTLPDLEKIKIPRCFLKTNAIRVVLLGFADASSKSYAAVIYIQTVSIDKESTCQLLCSKSRVAPTKLMTIPRLELCACLLLSKLTHKVISALKLQIESVQLWSDSTIALAWINTPPNRLKTFVGNRVSQIQQLTKDFQWRHVPSECNPADIISRGLDVGALVANDLWWNGPDLEKLTAVTPDSLQVSSTVTDQCYTNELKPISKLTLKLTSDSNFIDNLLDITNNFHKLIRILAFIFRFIRNCNAGEKQRDAITLEEFGKAEIFLIKHFQERYFSPEICSLKGGSSVSRSSKLKFLNPFIDKEGLLRVGGRISHSNVSCNQKYPIILPAGNKLVKLVFQYYHKRDFHVGQQALLNTVRLKYWPLGGRSIARKVVHECVDCFKINPVVANQIMGDLPSERVTSSSAFQNAGLDLCGPFLIKYKGQRKGTFQKIYVVIFVCMATKAVHLDFVSDLTADALIATLKRFFARRGKSSILFSDNATNFTGASAELKHLYKLVVKNEDIAGLLVSEGIKWKFLPPRAPNFGGLWEAGVKSFKYHLKRVAGVAKLTLEEFLTVITQIEGILNSRPLTPLSNDTDDFQVLTPGHFLIGKPINAIPEPDLTDKRENLLDKWQKTQRLVQIIWKRWRDSYLSHLQQRTKWVFKQPNIVPGMMVLIKDPQLPTCHWSMGRIIKSIPGPDGNVRVVDVNTPKGILRRPLSKISVLPIENFNC